MNEFYQNLNELNIFEKNIFFELFSKNKKCACSKIVNIIYYMCIYYKVTVFGI